MLIIQTSVVNNPKFIELQYLSFKKFVKGDFKFVVYNHAKDYKDYSNYYDTTSNLKQQIRDMCKKLGIECIDIVDNYSKNGVPPSASAALAINFVTRDSHIPSPNKYLFVDSDIFLIKEFDACKYDEYDCAYIPQHRNEYEYMWPGFFYLNTHTMKNLNLINWDMCKYTENNPQKGCSIWTDCGGGTGKWLVQESGNHKIKKFKHLSSGRWNENDLKIDIPKSILNFCKNDLRSEISFKSKDKYFCEIYDDVFLHYRAGCNWNGLTQDVIHQTLYNLEKALYEIINEN